MVSQPYPEIDERTPFENVSFARPNQALFRLLLERYMCGRIRVFQRRMVGPNFIVLIDGKIAGLFGFVNNYWGRTPSVEIIELQYDFAVDAPWCKHLSKLIVMAAMSIEARTVCERKGCRRITSLVTTVFSNYPDSMKYRGLLKKIKSERDAETGVYKLRYQGEFSKRTVQQQFEAWKTRGVSSDDGTPPQEEEQV